MLVTSTRYSPGQWNSASRTRLPWLDRIRELDPEIGVPVVHITKGRSLNELGRYHEAVEWFDRAIEIDPDEAEAYENKGNSLEVPCYSTPRGRGKTSIGEIQSERK